MTAQISPCHAPATPEHLLADPATAVAAAREHIAAGALRPSAIGPVGLELEFHLVDLARPDRRPAWDDVLAAAGSLPAMPAGSSVTLEPGGQIELSTPPSADLVSSVAALRADRDVLRTGLASQGYGAAPLGTDPARPTRRVNPSSRYVAMEQHFAALDCAEPGRAMMTGTAALQVNLDAGPRSGWRDRLALVAALGPVLVAVSSASPYLAGSSSGWHSMRQEIWHGIDHHRSEPIPADADPADAWASYGLAAPIMLVRDGTNATSMTERVPFSAWLEGKAPITRRPTLDDLDYHLTTLFPPVRPRGYLEIRCIDALPDRWWPAVAAFTAILVDDPVAAARAAELTEPVAGAWLPAARDGLRDPAIRTAVLGCVRAALERCPAGVSGELAALAELLDSGRTPADELRERADTVGPLRLLEEEARA